MKVLLCPMSDPGFLYPAIALGRELRDRGHAVTVLGRAAAAGVVARAGLSFAAAEAHGGDGGFSVARWRAGGMPQYRATRLTAADLGAEVLVTSSLCHGALLAAEVLDLPVVVLGLAAYLWDYPAGGEGEGDGEPPTATPRDWRTSEALRCYDELRRQAGLPGRPAGSGPAPLLGAALLLRGDPALEYPGASLPADVHHVGPCWWEPQPEPTELAEILAQVDCIGKPLVYVHLGRSFGGDTPWPWVNAAFTDSPFQAVVELGRSPDTQAAPGAEILVVRKPWLGPLVDRAGLVVTSATSTPVLAALLRGRPLLVAPAGSEQPMLAAACVRAGVARQVSPYAAAGHPASQLRAAWQDAGMRRRSAELAAMLSAAGGPGRAADIVARVAAGRVCV